MARKRDIQQIEAIAREFQMDHMERREFGDYVEECKRSGEKGSGPREATSLTKNSGSLHGSFEERTHDRESY